VPRLTGRFLRFALSEDGNLKTRLLRSGLWVGSGEILMTVLAVVKSVILARLLAPEMFGLMGLCAIVIGAIETFTRPGIGQALIQRQSSFEDARDTAFTLLLARGAILAMLLFFIAPFAAAYYGESELGTMLQFLSIVFVVGGFLNINTIARQKELNFRLLTYVNQSSAVLGTVATITAAYVLRNVWALVIGQLFTTTLHTLLSYYFIPGKPRLRLDRKIALELLAYGKFITASSAILFLATNIDTAVIGKVLGTENLGYYVLAFTFASLVTSNISKLASGIMMPAYSELQGDHSSLRNAYLRTLNLVSFLIFPATAGVLVTGSYIVHIVYGPKWAPAVGALQVLVIFGLLRSLAAINGYLFEGVGKPQISLYSGVARLVALGFLILPMTNAFGLVGAAASVAGAMLVQWLILIVATKRLVGVSIRQMAASMGAPLWKASLMALCVYSLSLVADGTTVPGLAALVGAGFIVYVLMNANFIRGLVREWQ
jgi:lipopolysaccharide exporter